MGRQMIPLRKSRSSSGTGTGFQSKAKKPIISQRSAEANAKTITFTIALIPIVSVILTESPGLLLGSSASAIFVTETHITVELELQ